MLRLSKFKKATFKKFKNLKKTQYSIGLKHYQTNAPCSEVVKLGVKVDGDGVVVGAEVVAAGVEFVAMVGPKV